MSDVNYDSNGAASIDISYSYEVDDQRFIGNKFSYNRQAVNGSEKKIRHQLENYQQGNAIHVYYKPSKPQKSTLVTGVSIIDLVISSIGLLMLIQGASIYLKTGSINKGINTMDESVQEKLKYMLNK